MTYCIERFAEIEGKLSNVFRSGDIRDQIAKSPKVMFFGPSIFLVFLFWGGGAARFIKFGYKYGAVPSPKFLAEFYKSESPSALLLLLPPPPLLQLLQLMLLL